MRRAIACTLCRARKLRCDHALPSCGQCVSRGDITSCHYVRRKNEARRAVAEPTAASGAASASASKIDNLERLLLNFIKSQRQGSSMPDEQSEHAEDDACSPLQFPVERPQHARRQATSITRHVTATPDVNPTISIAADHRRSSSVNQAHWALLMNEVSVPKPSLLLVQRMTNIPKIGGLRSALEGKQGQLGQPEQQAVDILPQACMHGGVSLLFGCSRNITRSEVLAQLPARYSCDILITRFFAHLYPAIRKYRPLVSIIFSRDASDLSRHPS